MNTPKRPPSALRDAAPYLGLGLQLAAVILIFYFVGSWADSKLDTTPWLMIAGVMIGAAGGFLQFFRSVSDLTKKDSPNSNDGSS